MNVAGHGGINATGRLGIKTVQPLAVFGLRVADQYFVRPGSGAGVRAVMVIEVVYPILWLLPGHPRWLS